MVLIEIILIETNIINSLKLTFRKFLFKDIKNDNERVYLAFERC
jgi:hypothetical protein